MTVSPGYSSGPGISFLCSPGRAESPSYGLGERCREQASGGAVCLQAPPVHERKVVITSFMLIRGLSNNRQGEFKSQDSWWLQFRSGLFLP